MGVLDKTTPRRYFPNIQLSNKEMCPVHHHMGDLPCPWPSCKKGVDGETIILMYPLGIKKEHRFERKQWQSPEGEDRFSWIDLSIPIYSMASKIVTEEIRRSLGSGPQFPNTIYHYTNIQGLYGIIDSKEFWLTDYSYMKDSREIEHGLEIAETVLRDLNRASKYSAKRTIIDQWQEVLNTVPYRICIACFCLKGHSLTLWRDHGRNTAVCLGLSSKDTLFWHPFGLNFDKVTYKKKNQRKIVEIIFHVYCMITEWNHQKGINVNGHVFQTSLITDLYEQIVFFKNASFSDEKEVRWVYIERPKMFGVDDIVAPKRFREDPKDPNILIPYVTSTDIISMFRAKGFPVANPQSGLLPLREVIVGPQENAELVRRSIREFLQTAGYGSVEVR